MERFDLAAGLRGKLGNSNEISRRTLAADTRDTEKGKKARSRIEHNPVLRALSHLRGKILPGRLLRTCRCSGRPCTCDGLESTLAREHGSNPNNPYAMYTPGRYMRGC
jgi:hypothetical protein